jgi:hypothetical protein
VALLRGLTGLLAIAAGLAAQTQPAYTAVVAGSGYQAPPATVVAPGQITTFFVGGLPRTAAGLAQVVAVTSAGAGQTQQIQVLSTKAVDSETLAITVQFPFAGVPVDAGPFTIQFAEADNPAVDLCAEGACTGPSL